jgi:hypothetical protein
MLFDRPRSRVRTPLWFLLFCLLWSDHTPPLKWEWRAIVPSCPAVTLVLCHVMEVSCYHSLWAVNCKYCLHLVTHALWPSLGINASRYLIKCTECWILFAWTSKSALQCCLRIHLDCLETSKINLFGPQDCLKRCRGGPWGKLIHPLGIPLALTICLSGESVVSIVNSCGSYPKKEGWWHRFWMRLNPILMAW